MSGKSPMPRKLAISKPEQWMGFFFWGGGHPGIKRKHSNSWYPVGTPPPAPQFLGIPYIWPFLHLYRIPPHSFRRRFRTSFLDNLCKEIAAAKPSPRQVPNMRPPHSGIF